MHNVNQLLREKCGVIGIWTASNHAPAYARRGLAALQHRGQESAGVSILSPQKKLITAKGMGLVPSVITDTVLKKLGQSNFAIAHNRYATSGSSSPANVQPIEVKHGKYHVSLGHNGNIPDISGVRKKLKGNANTVSDTNLMALLLAQERSAYATWEETLANVLPEFKGAYNLSILTNDGSLFGVRDPYGIRPLCLGRLPDGWIIASESVAIDAVGAEFVRDIKNGEIIKIDDKGEIQSFFFGEPKNPQFCIFEYIYFARPDSFINGQRIRTGRERSGKLLAERIKKKKIKADAIVPIFDSGYPAAKGTAQALNLPIVDAITTSHYVGRTFIQPGQQNRIQAVNGKHNIVPDEIMGKKVIIVDDSAVRLTTSSMLAIGLKNAGAREVYMAFASPPVVNQCDMGIDMRSKKELPAAKFEKESIEVIEKKMAEHVGVDGFIYLPIEETARAMNSVKENFYYYPFGGPHPIRGKQRSFPKLKKKIMGKPKICIFISGSGTNLQKIIDGITAEHIDAEIVAVVSNNPDAFGLTRATKHNIPAISLPYEGKLKDLDARKRYEEKLLKVVKKYSPDLILLSGWMFVLSDYFLKKVQQKEIPVINHHWALLTEDASSLVQTSRGTIPVIRGHHGFKDTFNANIPVGGITVHQILPGNGFDEGPIIMKSEVRRKQEDTLESWEKRNRDMEYLTLPAALKRILHVMQHNIDISKGEFPW